MARLIPITLAAMAVAAASPAIAQSNGNGAAPIQSECRIRATAAPASWIIEGYDPFGNSTPEATFSVTFTNDSDADCRFIPTWELAQPPFGLSKGTGKRIGYAILDLSESRDVTPRAGRSQSRSGNREVALKPKESQSILYKLIADPDDVNTAGLFTQNATIEAQDRSFRSFGGAPVLLGLNVLPSARIGLAGAFQVRDGLALVDLGDLKPGVAPVPLQVRVSSTGRYDISVSSANSGRLRLGASEWSIPYSMSLGGKTLNLLGGADGIWCERGRLPARSAAGPIRDRQRRQCPGRHI